MFTAGFPPCPPPRRYPLSLPFVAVPVAMNPSVPAQGDLSSMYVLLRAWLPDGLFVLRAVWMTHDCLMVCFGVLFG